MKKTVLALVPDVSPLTRSVISRAFNPVEFEVLWTANLSEAVEGSTRHHVDVVLLDLDQPLRADWGIYERLTTLNRGAPVVILMEHKTAHEEWVVSQGAAVLHKPISVAALTHAVRVLLGKPSPEAVPLANQDVGLRDATTASDGFREMIYERYTAPFDLATPYRHWGINE